MSEPTAHEQRMQARIDEESAQLAASSAALAPAPIAAILEIVHTTPGHRVRDHAYKALRETGQRHASDEVRLLIRRALDAIEVLARPVATPVERSPAPPRPGESVTISTMVAGERYRVGRDFVDFDGTPFRAGTVLTFVGYSYFPYDGGYTIRFAEAGMRLAEIDPGNEPVLANAGNAYFEPADQD